jgi:hypothetical protein
MHDFKCTVPGVHRGAHSIYRASGAAPLPQFWYHPWNFHSPSYHGHPAFVCRSAMHCGAQIQLQTLRKDLEVGAHFTCKYAP